jgi:hypothetical protein
MTALTDRVQAMLVAEPDPALDYYALTILSSKGGKLQYSCQSSWVGFTEGSPRREIREASLVHADRMVKVWRELGETALVVNTLDDMSLFFAFSGNAVVEQRVA